MNFINLLTIMIISAFSGSDIYYVGFGRPFDYIAIAILFYLLAFNGKYFNNSKLFFYFSISSILTLPWILIGYFNNNILATSVFFIGISLIFPIMASIEVCNLFKAIEKGVKFSMAINILFLSIQFINYYAIGDYLDFVSILGSIDSRGLNEEIGYFRPSGIFQEPNAYCTVMYSLLYICQYFNKRDYFLEITGIISLIISQSLWGFGAAFLLIYFLYGKKYLFFLMLFSYIIFVISNFLFYDALNSLINSSITFGRILNIEDDPSRAARYGYIENIKFNEFLFFGHGIDSQNFQSIAANGFGFLLYSFGLFGLTLLTPYLFFINKFNYKKIISVFFIFTSFSPFSYVYFWLWLAMISVLYRSKSTHRF